MKVQHMTNGIILKGLLVLYAILMKSESMSYLIQHSMQLIPCFNHTISVIAINHKDKSLCVLEVMSPQWPDLKKQKTHSGHPN